MLQDFGNAVETTLLLVIAGLLLALLARRLGWLRMGRVVTMATVLAAVPSCLLIINHSEATRYGYFQHERRKHITDHRVRLWIPPAASDEHRHNNRQ